jgi:hypothetical protein
MMVPLAGVPALLPALVDRDNLATANALEVLSYTLGGVIGPPLAGWLILAVGAPNVVLLDALSYLGFALALTRIGSAGARKDRAAATHSLGDAVRLLLSNRVLLATTLMFTAANLGLGALFVWLPIYADRTLGGGAGLYGALLGVVAAGEVAASALAGGWRPRLPLGALICAAQVLSGLALALLLALPTLAGAVTGLALFGVFSAPLTIWAQTLRMRVIPEALRGRAFALLRTLMQGGGPLGGVLAGAALPAVGVAAVIAGSAAVIAVPGLVGARVRALWEG